MAMEIRVPALGESIVEATVGRWLKRQGDHVTAGEALVELETDKVNLEVMAESDGVLGTIARQEGENVGIGDVLGTIETSDASATPRPAAAPTPPAAARPAEAPTDGRPAAPASAQAGPQDSGDKPAATPVAQRIAAEQGVDIGRIAGS